MFRHFSGGGKALCDPWNPRNPWDIPGPDNKIWNALHPAVYGKMEVVDYAEHHDLWTESAYHRWPQHHIDEIQRISNGFRARFGQPSLTPSLGPALCGP